MSQPKQTEKKPQQVDSTEPTELTQEDLRWITGGEGEGELAAIKPTATVFRD